MVCMYIIFCWSQLLSLVTSTNTYNTKEELHFSYKVVCAQKFLYHKQTHTHTHTHTNADDSIERRLRLSVGLACASVLVLFWRQIWQFTNLSSFEREKNDECQRTDGKEWERMRYMRTRVKLEFRFEYIYVSIYIDMRNLYADLVSFIMRCHTMRRANYEVTKQQQKQLFCRFILIFNSTISFDLVVVVFVVVSCLVFFSVSSSSITFIFISCKRFAIHFPLYFIDDGIKRNANSINDIFVDAISFSLFLYLDVLWRNFGF